MSNFVCVREPRDCDCYEHRLARTSPQLEALQCAMTQPAPTASRHPPVWPQAVAFIRQRYGDGARAVAVCRAIEERARVGREETYGDDLRPFNGRDARRDAFEEACDGVNYAEQLITEFKLKGDTDSDDYADALRLRSCFAEAALLSAPRRGS